MTNDKKSPTWTRLSIEHSHLYVCAGCGELADWEEDGIGIKYCYCNSCASERGAPDAYPAICRDCQTPLSPDGMCDTCSGEGFTYADMINREHRKKEDK